MKLFFAALIFFLLAFAGLAAGLFFNRRGIRGGCGSGRRDPSACRCQSSAGSCGGDEH